MSTPGTWRPLWLVLVWVTRASAEGPAPVAPRIAAIDFQAIPYGVLPDFPTVADDLLSFEPGASDGLVTTKGVERQVKWKRLMSRGGTERARMLEVRANGSGEQAIYMSTENATEVEGEALASLPCRREGDPGMHLRWERLVVAPEGESSFVSRDLWFDARECAVKTVDTRRAWPRPIAWHAGVPSILALRDDVSVTFFLPRAAALTVHTMVGSPVTVRGGFTRVTLPWGRWGSASFAATLMEPAFHPEDGSTPPTKRAAVPLDAKATSEVVVELVQTMSERAPTVLVRTRTLATDELASTSVVVD